MGFANRRLGALLIGFSVAAFASQGAVHAQTRDQIVEQCMAKMHAEMRGQDTSQDANRTRATNLYKGCMASAGQTP